MKFSPDGPDFPVALIEAAIRGEVVFLCGAGVSQPCDLPNFKSLTGNVFARLGLPMSQAERFSFDQKRYEETLGSLSRRLADRKVLYAAVAAELDADTAKAADTHHTILRLSRDFEGTPAVITTNFDTLLERALHDATKTSVRELSYASAQVPAPGGPRFEGIIHLHGRLADVKLGLDESDLVLTSADYGDAYLRSGWAARFLYDLARTRTIVLVGYSASDAPVRYILNILEADRERFPDLRRIYVLSDNAGLDVSAAAAAWDAIAVEPVIFSVDFPAFWRDMGAFADLVEAPRQWRHSRITALVGRPAVELTNWEKAQAKWILSQPDAIELLGRLPAQADWIAFVREQELLKADTASDWAICAWAARNLAQRDAFHETLTALPMIGRRAAGVIDRALDAKDRATLPGNLEKAWRLLTAVARQARQDRWSHYAAFDRVRDKHASGDDLVESIRLFVPEMRIAAHSGFYLGVGDEDSLSSLCRIEFETNDYPAFDELLEQVPAASPDLWSLLRLADAGLTGALVLARDANMVRPDYDASTFDIPSIADHPQNKHHSSFLPIVRLCAELWRRLLPLAPAKARATADAWRHGGSAITTRLWLYTLHQDDGVSSDAIVDGLLTLAAKEFWAHRKEVAELLRDRVAQANADLVERLVDQIVAGPEVDTVIQDPVGVRDAYRWVYLAVLAQALAPLPAQAQDALQEIRDRRQWQGRQLKERDLFWAWSHGVRMGPIGDPVPIAGAPLENRVEIAENLERDDRLNQTDVWRVYCESDAEGALASLIAAGQIAVHGRQWRDVLWAIPNIGADNDDAKAKGRSLVLRATDALRTAPNEELAELVHPLADLLVYASRLDTMVVDDLWDWLWRCALMHERAVAEAKGDKDAGYQLISQAINSASGKLARLMVNRLGLQWRDQPEDQRLRLYERFELMLSSTTDAGFLARAVNVESIAWLDASLPELVDRHLVPALSAENSAGFALRSLLVGVGRGHGPSVQTKLRDQILRGVREFTGKGGTAENAAARLLYIVFDDRNRRLEHPDPLPPGIARATLMAASGEIRAAAAEVLADWLAGETEKSSHEAWRTDYGPVFRSIWPADRGSLTSGASVSLAKLALSAGAAFPEALETVRPYIVPLMENWPKFFFAAHEGAKPIITAHPREALTMMWLLAKPATLGQSIDLGKVLDAIAVADPALVRDRRFQLLETRAYRL